MDLQNEQVKKAGQTREKNAFDSAAQCHSAYELFSFFVPNRVKFFVICVSQRTHVCSGHVIYAHRDSFHLSWFFVVVPVLQFSFRWTNFSIRALFHSIFLALFYLFPLFTSSLYACRIFVVLVGFLSVSYLCLPCLSSLSLALHAFFAISFSWSMSLLFLSYFFFFLVTFYSPFHFTGFTNCISSYRMSIV